MWLDLIFKFIFHRRIVGKGEPVFQAIWTDNTDYDEVLISPGMIQDHLPDKVLKALNRVFIHD